MKDQSNDSPDPGSQAQPSLPEVGQSKNPDGKRQGHIAELAFMHKAAELGFGVTKPYGEVEPYDFILDSGRRLWRVQVKSTAAPVKRKRSYYVQPSHCSSACGKKTYTSEEIDFLVAYVVPREARYVIPVGALPSVIKIHLYPDTPRSRGRFECYRGAWCLMACPRHGPPRPEIAVDRRCSSCPRPDIDWPLVTAEP
jgi:PD-(D/E)XK endonuclease